MPKFTCKHVITGTNLITINSEKLSLSGSFFWKNKKFAQKAKVHQDKQKL